MKEHFYSPSSRVFNIINWVGLSCSVLIIVSVILSAPFRSHFRQSNALRIQVAVSCIDVFRHAVRVHVVKPSGFLCSLLGFFMVYWDHVYIILTTVIAFNLHQVFYKEVNVPKSIRKLQWILPFFLILIVDAVPAAFGVYGLTKGKICFIKNPMPFRSEFAAIYKGLFQMVPLIYCLFVFFLIHKKKFLPPRVRDVHDPSNSQENLNERARHAQATARSIALYPLFCFVCFFGQTLNHTANYFGVPHWFFNMWGAMGTSITGITNLIALFLNPNFQHALHNMWYLKKEPPRNVQLAIARSEGESASHASLTIRVDSNSVTSTRNNAELPKESTPLLHFNNVVMYCDEL